MATTTPNFGWPVPTSTDLVKNGATAIEALGDAIDASLVDLEGGTTGQVLSKASNTDMDFAWTTPTDQTPLTTKGDLFTFTTVDARLGVGTNGQVLTADSTAATGLAWATASGGSTNVAGKNGVLNSAMNVWQRSTSSTIATSSFTFFGPDRWQVYRGNSGSTVSRQVTGDTTNLPNIQYCARFQRDNGNSTTEQFYIANNFETINSIPYAGKTVTFSFYARKGANYSATSSTLVANLRSGEGTDQNYNNTYTGNTLVAGGSVTLTTTWQRFTYTGTVSSAATELCVFFNSTPTGTAGAADYFDITGVQVEIAGSASAYSPNTSTYQAELQACLRYYWRSEAGSANQKFAQGPAYAATNALTNPITMPVPMRIKPSTLDYGGTIWFQQHAGAGGNSFTSLTINSDYTNTKQVVLDITLASGLSAGVIYELKANSSASAYIGISAEL